MMPVCRFQPLCNLMYVTTAISSTPSVLVFSLSDPLASSLYFTNQLLYSQPIYLRNYSHHYFFQVLPQLAQDRCRTPSPGLTKFLASLRAVFTLYYYNGYEKG